MTSKNLNLKGSVTPTVTVTSHGDAAKAEAREKLKKFIEDETRMVKGIFKNFETPNGMQPVYVKKYKDVPAFKMTMFDGGTYEVPLYVARFLNGIDVTSPANDGKLGTCSYPIHGFNYDGNPANLPASQLGVGPDGTGGVPQPTTHIVRRKQRFGFQSLEFGSAFAA